jgi:hypothetical protein
VHLCRNHTKLRKFGDADPSPQDPALNPSPFDPIPPDPLPVSDPIPPDPLPHKGKGEISPSLFGEGFRVGSHRFRVGSHRFSLGSVDFD